MRHWYCLSALAIVIGTAALAQDNTTAAGAAGPPLQPDLSRNTNIPADNIASPAPGKGQIVFYRRGGMLGAAISCAVHEGGIKLTSLPPGRFAVVEVDPGVHNFSVKSEATDTIRIEIQSGQTAYASCHVTMGIVAGRPKLEVSNTTAFFADGQKLKPVAK